MLEPTWTRLTLLVVLQVYDMTSHLVRLLIIDSQSDSALQFTPIVP